LKLGGVLHKLTRKTITLLGVICKHHGLSCFGLGFRRGIVHA
jgi:hypothetical protein